MIYTGRGIMRSAAERKGLKSRSAGQNADREDLLNRVDSGARWANIRRLKAHFPLATTLPRGENLAISRQTSHRGGGPSAHSRGDINESAEI
jgi:hypothetical protein